MPRRWRAVSHGAVLSALAAWACGGDAAAPGEVARFAFPLVGTLDQTLFYVNYVDQAADAGIRDYHCGPKTYDGHLGTDITLPSFRTMDSGVAVVAAAAGTVSAVHDGEFDRHKSWTDGVLWNYVTLRHGDGVQTIYGHLKQNSVAVAPGQAVQAGTVLGEVGSSGRSDMPHLHFEVRDARGTVVDPWAGPCGADASRWLAQDTYRDGFAPIASGVTDAVLTLDLVKDPPAQVDTFSTADMRVTMWVQLVNVRAGSAAKFLLYQPDGALFFTFLFTHQQFYSMSWWWFWHAIPGYLTVPGTWRLQYVHDGVALAERSFALVASPAVQAAPPAGRLPRAGSGGGALRRSVR